MSKFNGRKVAYATMHETIHTPLTGELKKSLSSTPSPTDKAVSMEMEESFVAISVNHKGQVLTVLVPITNFKSLVLAPEVPKVK